MKNIYGHIICLAAAASLASCSFFDVTPQIIASETFYNTESEVKYGLAGVYGVIGKEQFYGNYYSLMFANADDLCYFNRDVGTNFLQYNRHDATTIQIYDIWTALYPYLRRNPHRRVYLRRVAYSLLLSRSTWLTMRRTVTSSSLSISAIATMML